MAVSSSCIRRLLSQGNVSEAAAGLGYDYFLNGTVVGGHRVGRTIGYPTANLRVNEPDKLIPSDGVYAVRVRVAVRSTEECLVLVTALRWTMVQTVVSKCISSDSMPIFTVSPFVFLLSVTFVQS